MFWTVRRDQSQTETRLSVPTAQEEDSKYRLNMVPKYMMSSARKWWSVLEKAGGRAA